MDPWKMQKLYGFAIIMALAAIIIVGFFIRCWERAGLRPFATLWRPDWSRRGGR